MTPRTAYFVVWRLGEVGGMERHFCDLAVALKREGTIVTVFIEQPVCAENRYVRALRQEGIAVIVPSWITRTAIRLEHRWLYRRATSWRRESPATFALLRALKRRSRGELPDVVHVHGCHLAQRAVLQWAKSRDVPAAYTEHITIADWQGPGEGFAPELFEQADATIACVSERSRESLARILRSPIALATHIVPDVMYQASEPSEEGPLRLLSVGRLELCKGHHVLLQAAAILRDEGLSFRLVIAGDGEERAALEILCRDLRLESEVVFAGLVDQDSIPALWARADLGVLPSITEGLPISLLEALAAGRPMIATDVGGMAEVLTDGVEGFLVAADDPAALASAIVRCADRGKLVAMGRAARARFERGPWSARHAVEQAAELYDIARISRRRTSETFLERYRSECECLSSAPPMRVALCTYRLAAFGTMEQRITRQALALSSLGMGVTLHVERPVQPFNRYRRALRRARVPVFAPTMMRWLVRQGWTRITRGSGPMITPSYLAIGIERPDAVHVHGWQFGTRWSVSNRRSVAATTSNTRTVYEEHDAVRKPMAGSLTNLLAFDALIAPTMVSANQMATAFGGDHPPIIVIDCLDEVNAAPAAPFKRAQDLKVFALVELAIRAQLSAIPDTVIVSELGNADAVVLTPSIAGYATALSAAMASLKPVILTDRDWAGPIRHRINGLIARDLAEEIECVRNDPLLARQLAVAARRTYDMDGHDRLAIARQLAALYRPSSKMMTDAQS